MAGWPQPVKNVREARSTMASVREVTAIVDKAEDEVVRLASASAPPGAIALTRLRMLRAVAGEHDLQPDDDFLVHLAEALSEKIATRTLTESMARWMPIVGRLIEAMAEARLTHEMGWAAHEHFASLDKESKQKLRQVTPSRPAEPSSIPDALLPDGSPNPLLISHYESASWVGVAELERRLAHDPNDDDLLVMLAFAYYTSGKLDRAIELYQRTIVLDEKNAQAHYYLANAYFRRGKFPLAREEWERVVALDPAGRLGINANRRAASLRRLKP